MHTSDFAILQPFLKQPGSLPLSNKCHRRNGAVYHQVTAHRGGRTRLTFTLLSKISGIITNGYQEGPALFKSKFKAWSRNQGLESSFYLANSRFN